MKTRDIPTMRVERALIGSVLCDPRLRKRCGKLLPSHFTGAAVGLLWKELMTMKYPDAVLLYHAMETSVSLPPPGDVGWATFIAHCLEDACPIEECVDEYIDVIRAEAALRKRVPW